MSLLGSAASMVTWDWPVGQSLVRSSWAPSSARVKPMEPLAMLAAGSMVIWTSCSRHDRMLQCQLKR